MLTFNLATEPWIPVLSGGTRTEKSLGDALTGAHEFDGFTVDDPLQAVALLRQGAAAHGLGRARGAAQ